MKKATDDFERRAQDAENSYGKVTQDEYLRLLSESREFPKIEETLRENFDIGITVGGNFFVDYHVLCDVCNFEFEFKRTVSATRKTR